jgi:hypothetical protein
MSVATPVGQARQVRQPVAVAATLVCAASMLGLGLWDGLVVALTGFAVASGLHTIAHAIDRHLGGHDSDAPSLALLTLVALAAVTARMPAARGRGQLGRRGRPRAHRPPQAPLRHSGMALTNRLRTQGTTNLLAAAEALGARRFLTQSAIFGYGYRDHGPRPLTEQDPFGRPAGGQLRPGISC